MRTGFLLMACGGACLLNCGTGAGCALANDCVSGVCGTQGCPAGVARCCQAPSCNDDVRNGTESDVDCGNADDESGCVAECVPGESYCTADFAIDYCNAYGYWESWDCDAVCQDAGYSFAEGCSYDSWSASDACFCM